MKKPYELGNLKTFKSETGKIYPHYRRHKPNSRQVSLEIFQKNQGELNEKEIKIFVSSYNMGYKDAWKRDNEITSDSCLNCEIKLGFRGYCSRDCHKEYNRKPDGHKNRKSKEFIRRKNNK